MNPKDLKSHARNSIDYKKRRYGAIYGRSDHYQIKVIPVIGPFMLFVFHYPSTEKDLEFTDYVVICKDCTKTLLNFTNNERYDTSQTIFCPSCKSPFFKENLEQIDKKLIPLSKVMIKCGI